MSEELINDCEVSIAELRNWLHDDKLTLQEKLLLCLAANNYIEKRAATIVLIAEDCGWDAFRDPSNPIISRGIVCDQLLARETSGFAINRRGVWELINTGQSRVRQIASVLTNQPAAIAASTLQDVLPDIPNEDARDFVKEVIRNMDCKSYRSAVVLSWCGTVALLRDHILNDANLLDNFNAEATKRNPKWKDAQVTDDFARMKEFDFLQVLAAVSPGVSKDLKQRLEDALKLRNSCGHPNSLVIDPHMVQAHVAMLARNVFAKFG